MLMIHNPKCENHNITTIRTSSDSHLHWKRHFHRNPFYFMIFADFKADEEMDNSSIGNEKTITYKQNSALNGYHIESELDDVLQSGFQKFPLGYENIDWFVNGVIELQNEMTFYFKNTEKHINMTGKDQEEYRNKNICQFCEINFESDKVRDNCHLTGNYTGPAHSKSTFNVTQDKSKFIPFLFHNFSNDECHLVLKS